ncbi:MAG: translation initiation factor IF-2 N-terminal domain-containing protein, partial [Myxococcota bacterium]
MAKVRAYKLAEELGIDRNEIVDKAASAGVELRNAMASLDEDVAAELRRKLGGGGEAKVVTEQRVQRGSGAAVIRRRKRREPDPVPEPEVAPPVELAVTPEPVVADAVVEGALSEEPEAPAPKSLEESAPEPIAAEAAPGSAEAEKRTARKQTSETPGPSRTAGPAGADRKGAGPRKLVREVVNLREQENLARQATGRAHQRRQVTIDPRTATSPRRKRRDALSRPAAVQAATEVRRVVRVDGTISVADLARSLGAKAPEVQRRLMALGTMVAINQSVDMETARSVAGEFDYEVQDVGFDEGQYISTGDAGEEGGVRVPRPPVITVMGHVDHGKTSLLDAIRNTKVVDGESGGITQHIGAYRVTTENNSQFVVLDTPGHAAFTSMRARGASLTDIVVLVVAADDGVMPQTEEAINHALQGKVPIIVAVNKCDAPGANPMQVRQQLSVKGLQAEEWGGSVQMIDVSALTGQGLDDLVEKIMLEAELLELEAKSEAPGSGIVIESRQSANQGVVVSVLVTDGTLHVRDMMICGESYSRVRG